MHRFSLRLSLICMVSLGWLAPASQALVINEIQSKNTLTIADDDGKFEDWVEIYNPGPQAIDLTGYFLSDEDADPYKWTFPAVGIPSGGFLLIWASDKEPITGSQIHASFKLAAEGEEVILSAPNGLLIDRLPPISLQADWSVGHQPDGTGPLLFFEQPTPWTANTTPGIADALDAPVFSVPPGFFEQSISVVLTSADPVADIRYTLDGSVPTETSALYTSSLLVESRVGDPNVISEIPTNDPDRMAGTDLFFHWVPPLSEVFKSTVLRARAFRDGHIPSPTVTSTYFVGAGVSSRYPYPVISLVTAADNFFDDLIGIYVPGLEPLIEDLNYFQHGDEWERPVHMEFFEPSGLLGFAGGMGARLHGAYSREHPIKTVRLYARGEYGPNEIIHPIFPQQSLPRYKRLLLRPGGQDQFFTYCADVLTQSVVEHMKIDTQASRQAVVFLNGEYWGVHNVRERHDRYFVEAHYGVDDDDVIVLKQEQGFPPTLLDGETGEEQLYVDVQDFIANHDLSDEAEFEHLETLMDVESYRDFIVAQAFSSNPQWGARVWRKRTQVYEPDAPEGHDGRWRWMIFDLDFGFRHWARQQLTLNLEAPETPMFVELLDNPGWRTGFINRYADQLNTAFLPSVTLAAIDSMQAAYTPGLPEHMQRWLTPGYMSEHPGTLANWNTIINYKRFFANERPGYARTDIVEFFGLSGTWNLTLSTSNAALGSIRLNTLQLDGSELPWQGLYFDDVPVMLEALAESGYAFVGWTGDVVSADNPMQVVTAENLSLTANFLQGAGSIPDGNLISGPPLTIGKFPDGDLDIQWSASCLASDQNYAVYKGSLGEFSSNEPISCDTLGATELRIDPPTGDVYFLVVPNNGTSEGSYGHDGSGDPRLPSPLACLPQAAAPC